MKGVFAEAVDKLPIVCRWVITEYVINCHLCVALSDDSFNYPRMRPWLFFLGGKIMTVKKLLPKIIIIAVVVGFGVLCAFTGPINDPVGTLWSLFPPVIAIGLALITKEAYSSLFVGIVAGGLLYSKFNPIHAVDSVISDGLISAVSGTAGIFVFLVVLGIIVALINKAGGSAAFGRWASKHVKGKIGASIATFIFGVLIFIDDYFNCLTVGAVMRPVTDNVRMSRAKLSYLIDATAAPVCMIAPMSSWAAAVSEFAPEGTNGIVLFCQAIPYNFYSLLTFVFIIAITLMKFDYGPMKLHEFNASKGDLFTSGVEHEAQDDEKPATDKGRVIDLIIPIVVLIAICFIALPYVGRCMGEEWVFNSANYDSSLNFIDAFSNTDATVALPWGGLIALVFVIIYFVARRLVTFKQAMECIPKGFIAMVPAILILTMATSLKNMTTMLDSDAFVQSALAGAAGLQNFLPAIVFVVACLISFATGTSWGTFGILIPIVLSIFPAGTELGIIGMSACLAGAVCGDHCSPISDTTIMSSAGARCDHINHVSTQLPYAITVAAIAFVTFIVAGFVQNPWISITVGIVLTLATLFVIKFTTAKQKLG